MFIFAHIGITALFAFFLSLSPLTAAFTCLIPDLIDKPLNIIGLAPISRFIGHTLFMVFLTGIVFYLITRKKVISISAAFGVFIHLIEDSGFIPWLFPFKKYVFPVKAFKFRYTLFLFITDMIGIIILIILYKKDGGFRREVLKFFNEIKSFFTFSIKHK